MDKFDRLAKLYGEVMQNRRAASAQGLSEEQEIAEATATLEEFLAVTGEFKPEDTPENKQAVKDILAIEPAEHPDYTDPANVKGFGELAPIALVRVMLLGSVPINGNVCKNWSGFVQNFKFLMIDA